MITEWCPECDAAIYGKKECGCGWKSKQEVKKQKEAESLVGKNCSESGCTKLATMTKATKNQQLADWLCDEHFFGF